MSATLAPRKTRKQLFDELMRVEGKAEIIGGEIVHLPLTYGPSDTFLPMTGGGPGYAGDEIFVSLRAHARKTGHGRAVGDGKGFIVNLPQRDSLSPDAAFYVGPDPGMKFYDGAPLFAVEVRSEGDYSPAAERAMAEKRADYFAAGTLVVWDVDLQSSDVVIASYRAEAPLRPRVFRRGQMAEAEPALPGWTFAVDDLFA